MSILNSDLARIFMAVYGATTPRRFMAIFLGCLLALQVSGSLCGEDTLSLSFLGRSILATLFWPSFFTLLWHACYKVLSRLFPTYWPRQRSYHKAVRRRPGRLNEYSVSCHQDHYAIAQS